MEKIVSLLLNVAETMPTDLEELFAAYENAINNDDFEKAEILELELTQKTDPHHSRILAGRAEMEFKHLLNEL